MTQQAGTRITEALRSRLEDGCASKVFPGASASVSFWQRGGWERVDVCAGVRMRGEPVVTADTFYDLASLTKPFVATTALRLHQLGRFPLDDTVSKLIPEAEGTSFGERRWDEVLSHRSGLEAWAPFYESLPAPPGSEAARRCILAELSSRFDEKAVGMSVYSDLGYIVAGIALARAARASLERLVTEHVTRRLGIDDAAFYAAVRRDEAWLSRCAPTGASTWRGRDLRGEVHDDNCAALGGVAGHAGMFGTAPAVARFGEAWVSGWQGRRGALEEEATRFATAERPGGTHRLGWDGKSDALSAAGSRLGRESFGHLGFTGTSLWCDPRRQLVIVLLTNRVAVSDDNTAIRAFRPEFHDAVVDAFDDV